MNIHLTIQGNINVPQNVSLMLVGYWENGKLQLRPRVILIKTYMYGPKLAKHWIKDLPT
jgi:hypothetical protein